MGDEVDEVFDVSFLLFNTPNLAAFERQNACEDNVMWKDYLTGDWYVMLPLHSLQNQRYHPHMQCILQRIALCRHLRLLSPLQPTPPQPGEARLLA